MFFLNGTNDLNLLTGAAGARGAAAVGTGARTRGSCSRRPWTRGSWSGAWARVFLEQQVQQVAGGGHGIVVGLISFTLMGKTLMLIFFFKSFVSNCYIFRSDILSWTLTFSFSLEVSSELLWLVELCPLAAPPCTEGDACWDAASAVATSNRLLGDSSSWSKLRGEEHRDWKRGDSAPSRSAGVWV